jgi:hypothetical protein
MDKDGYPEEKELKLIQKWNVHDVMNLIDYIEERWWMPDWGFKKEWGRDYSNDNTLYLELHTGGWSGNESIIHALLKNTFFNIMFYSQWNRGGHYKFEINMQTIGYKPANELAKEK